MKYVSHDPIAAKTGRPLDSPGVVVTDESGKEAPGFAPPHPDTSATAAGAKDDAAPWRRPGSLRARPTTRYYFVVRRNYIFIFSHVKVTPKKTASVFLRSLCLV